jgi:membrane protease subunit HflK
MQPAKAPDEVKDAFDDAIKAQEDEQRFENQAETYAMQVAANAKGQAQRLLADAKAYQAQVVLNAQASTTQFLALLPQYQAAPAITRERLYLETMQKILVNNNKVLVDTVNGNNMIYLPLDKWPMLQSNPNNVAPPLKTSASSQPASRASTNTDNVSANTDLSITAQGGY